MHLWEESGYVERVPGLEQKWRLTDLGHRQLYPLVKVKKQQPLVEVRDVPPADMSKYELLLKMNDDGWQFRQVHSRKERQHARDHSYARGSDERVWYAGPGDKIEDLKTMYFVALLTCACAVPHLAPSAVYHKLLDPSWAPAPKRRKLTAGEADEWGPISEPPGRKQRDRGVVHKAGGVKRVRGPARLAAVAPLEVDSQEEDVVSGSDRGSDPGTASSHHSTSSSSRSDHDRGPGREVVREVVDSAAADEAAEIDVLAALDAAVAVEAVEAESQAGAEAAPPPPPPSSEHRQATFRKLRGRIPFGSCFLTPRYRDGGVVVGYQMTCTRREHNVERRCTRECSVKSGGGEESTRRLLKAWIVFASSADNLADHRSSWAMIKKLGEDLPSEHDLDTNAPLDWSMYACDFSEDAAIAAFDKALATGGGAGDMRDDEILGAANVGCPEEVHRLMQDLAAGGSIPHTTAAQRARSKLSSGSEYRTPPALMVALRYGYISPNHPPPRGLAWRCRGGNIWILCPRGG